jgi:hypothetical protein
LISLIIALTISASINVLLVWYIRKMLAKLLYVSDSIGDLLVSAKNFSSHLDSVHEMETFYGDETLGSLLKHSRQMIEDIGEFEGIYTLTNDGLGEDEEQE